MSYVRIWVHVVFSTRNHEQYLNSDLRCKLIDHIKINCRNKEIFLDSIGSQGNWAKAQGVFIDSTVG